MVFFHAFFLLLQKTFKMRVLVTGAAGFIGSHTCESLMKRGNSVVAIDVVNDYYDVKTKNQTILELELHAEHLLSQSGLSLQR